MLAAEKSTKARRSLGIGYIGLAHYLAKNKLKYQDKEAAMMVNILTEKFQYALDGGEVLSGLVEYPNKNHKLSLISSSALIRPLLNSPASVFISVILSNINIGGSGSLAFPSPNHFPSPH